MVCRLIFEGHRLLRGRAEPILESEDRGAAVPDAHEERLVPRSEAGS
jgi:hypothetical protein